MRVNIYFAVFLAIAAVVSEAVATPSVRSVVECQEDWCPKARKWRAKIAGRWVCCRDTDRYMIIEVIREGRGAGDKLCFCINFYPAPKQ